MNDNPFNKYVRQAAKPGSAVTADVPDPKQRGFDSHADAPCLMLDLVLRDGKRLARPYSYLTAVRLEPSGAITLQYADENIEITGRNLLPLYNSLLLHLVRRVVETANDFDDGKDGTWVKSITASPRKG